MSGSCQSDRARSVSPFRLGRGPRSKESGGQAHPSTIPEQHASRVDDLHDVDYASVSHCRWTMW